MSTRIVRGGSWLYHRGVARCAVRFTYFPDDRYYSLGFRVAKQLPQPQDRQVIRGGSWYDDARDCRSAVRFRYQPDYRHDDLGFRVIEQRNTQ